MFEIDHTTAPGKGYKICPWTDPTIFSADIYRRLEAGHDCGSGVGPGWIPLVERLNEELQDVDPDYTIGQIKEKFGSLRFYARSASLRYEPVAHDAKYKEFRGLIDAAEMLSASMCEVCGRKGKQDSRTGWVKTLCWWHSWVRFIRDRVAHLKWRIIRSRFKRDR